MAYLLHRARNCGFAVAILCVAFGCGGGGGESASAPPVTTFATTRPVDMSDMEIAQLVYSDSNRTPAGFYVEPTPNISGYVSTSHLKNSDLSATPVSTLFELCTDDWLSALNWSDQVAATSNLVLADSATTTSYYEFDRVRPGIPDGYVRSRVYRCSYLDRSGVDLRTASGSAGQLNARPVTADGLKQLAEYLWQFTAYNNYGNAVLKSSGVATNAGFEHTLTIAMLTTATGSSSCDRIEVIGWTHAVDSQTGALHLQTQSLWDFGARRIAGVVELCNSN